MTRAIDPFEEYLRKKKVEMLEKKYRGPKGRGAVAEEEHDDETVRRPPAEEQQDEKLQEEVEDFFASGQSAAQRLFDRVGDGLPEEKVDEIRDALDEVFVETEGEPTAEGDGNFVNFFREVQTSFDEERAERERAEEAREGGAEVVAPTEEPEPVPESPPAVEPPPSGEVFANGVEFVHRQAAGDPEDGADDPGPLVLEEEPEESALRFDDDTDPFDAEPVDVSEDAAGVGDPRGDDDEASAEAATAVGSLSGFEQAAPRVTDAVGEDPEVRLDLGEILGRPATTAEEIQQRTDLLCRLVTRLVERSDIDQRELVEMLIKAGVEF